MKHRYSKKLKLLSKKPTSFYISVLFITLDSLEHSISKKGHFLSKISIRLSIFQVLFILTSDKFIQRRKRAFENLERGRAISFLELNKFKANCPASQL